MRIISIRFQWPWERKLCQLVRLTFYSHAQWGITPKFATCRKAMVQPTLDTTDAGKSETTVQRRDNVCTRSRTNACTNTHRHRSGYRYSMGLWHPTMTARSAGNNGWSLATMAGRWPLKNTGTGGLVSLRF